MSATIPMIQNDVLGLIVDSVMIMKILVYQYKIGNKFKMRRIGHIETN
jgi:hypothetical protein